MLKFLRNLLATVVGLFIFFGLGLFILIAIGVAMGSSSETVSVKSNSVLDLDLSKVKYDYAGKVNFKDFSFKEENTNGLINVLQAIDMAKTDERIKGISLVNVSTVLGLEQLRELRNKIEDFKGSGKFVLAYSEMMSQKQYYLNSVADSVYLNPMGQIDFKGLSTEILYLKDLQEKMGIKMEVIRHGKYKSAVEPYLDNQMSAANREQIQAFLDNIWKTVASDIAQSRSISLQNVYQIADDITARLASGALKENLIDQLIYQDEFDQLIKTKLDVAQNKDYNKISILDYAKDVAEKNKKIISSNQIALVFAQGEILSGEGSVSYIGEKSINRALKKARENDKIKAVVIRVNSPGGSALTSDLIWREIELTKKVKPVIVSLGDVAASGGYYIACNANYIFSDPATITGSIGVFGMLPNMSELASKYGITPQEVKTNKNASSYSLFSPLDPSVKQVFTQGVEQTYETFVSRVAQGRGMSFEQVDEIAQGRVWTGEDALEIGLVDKLGGLEQAIAHAVELVGIDDYKLVNYPEYNLNSNDFLSFILGGTMLKTQDELLIEKIGQENFQLLERLNYFKRMEGIQAILPYQINIQ